MLRVLGHSSYRRLFLAQIVALTGTGLATVALGLLAYDLDPSNAGGVLGTALAVKMIAYVFVAPVAAAAVTRLSRRVVMVGSDAVRLVVAVSLPFVGEAWQVYVLIFVLQAASATFTPTFQSLIPDILPDEEDFTAALSLSRLAYDLEAVLSPMLAAVLLLMIPSTALFFGTGIGFAASGALVLVTVLPRRDRAPDGAPQMPFGERARHGIMLFLRTPALRPVLTLNLVVAAAGSFVVVQTVVIARTTFGQGDAMVALLLAANGAGSMGAAIALPGALHRLTERSVMIGGAVLLTLATASIPIALSAATPTTGLLAVGGLWILVGCGWAAVETPVGRLIRRGVAPRDLPAAFAAQFSLSHACWLVTYPLAGWLGGISLGATAVALTVLACCATLAAAWLWPRTQSAERGMVGP